MDEILNLIESVSEGFPSYSNLNTLLYFDSLTSYEHILFSNNYGYILLIFNRHVTANQIIVIQILLVLSENAAIKQYANSILN